MCRYCEPRSDTYYLCERFELIPDEMNNDKIESVNGRLFFDDHIPKIGIETSSDNWHLVSIKYCPFCGKDLSSRQIISDTTVKLPCIHHH